MLLTGQNKVFLAILSHYDKQKLFALLTLECLFKLECLL